MIQEHFELVVVFGGRSEIGIELALRLAAGATVVLAARGQGSWTLLYGGESARSRTYCFASRRYAEVVDCWVGGVCGL